MNLFKKYVLWKMTHNQKKPEPVASRNLFHKDMVFFLNRGLNIDRDTAIVTDKSIAAYGDATSVSGSLSAYLGNAADFAGKTLSMTFTPMTEFVSPLSTALTVINKSWSTIVSGTTVALNGGYHSCITIPEEPEEGSRLAIRLYGRNLTPGAEVKIDNIMVYEGTEPLPYEPYKA